MSQVTASGGGRGGIGATGRSMPSPVLPEIYVTPTDSSGVNKLPGMDTKSAGRRDSTNSNLSSSMPNLASDEDFDGEEDATKPKDVSLFCSPRPSRRNTEPKRSHHHHHNGQANYPFLKCIGRPHRERLESTDSNESDCSASHLSTCATSDYTHLTSLDMLNIMSMRDQYHGTLGNDLMVSSTGTLRRTHSNPENCVLADDSTSQGPTGHRHDSPGLMVESSESSSLLLRDSKSCSNLDTSDQSLISPRAERPTHLLQGSAHETTGTSKAQPQPMAPPDPSMLHAANKSLAVSEENLLSRVNRWLGDVEQTTDTNTTTS